MADGFDEIVLPQGQSQQPSGFDEVVPPKFDEVQLPQDQRKEEISASPTVSGEIAKGNYTEAIRVAKKQVEDFFAPAQPTSALQVHGAGKTSLLGTSEQIPYDKNGSTPVEYGKAFVNWLNPVMHGLTSPEMVSAAPLAELPGAGYVFAADTLAGLPDAVKNVIKTAHDKGWSPQTLQASLETLGQAGMSVLAARGDASNRKAATLTRPEDQTSPSEPTATAEQVPEGPINPELGAAPIPEATQPQTDATPEAATPEPGIEGAITEIQRRNATDDPWAEYRTKVEGEVPTEDVPSTEQKTTGVSNEAFAKMAEKGQIDEVSTGEGMSTQELIDKGKNDIAKGVDPYEIARRAQRTGRLSDTEFAVLRAHAEDLHARALSAEVDMNFDKTPETTQKYESAFKDLNDWNQNVVQPAKTRTSNIFRAMQGERPIDASSYTGLREAMIKTRGRDVKPSEQFPLRTKAKAVQDANARSAKAIEDLNTEITKSSKPTAKIASMDEFKEVVAKKLKEVAPCEL